MPRHDHEYAPRRIVPDYQEGDVRSNGHDNGCAKCGGSPLGHGIERVKTVWYLAGGAIATIAVVVALFLRLRS